jgi:hypothetical protein
MIPPISPRLAQAGVRAAVISPFEGSERETVISKPDIPFGRESAMMVNSAVVPTVGIDPLSAMSVVPITAGMLIHRSTLTRKIVVIRLTFIESSSNYSYPVHEKCRSPPHTFWKRRTTSLKSMNVFLL